MRRDAQLDLPVGALGDLVHVVQRKPFTGRPEVDPLQQSSTLELLTNVRSRSRATTMP